MSTTTKSNGRTTIVNGVTHVGDEVYTRFRQTLDSAKREVDSVQVKLHEYDEQYQASAKIREGTEKATEYFQTTVEETKKTLEDLSTQTKSIFDQSKEVPMRAISRTLAAASEQVEKLGAMAKTYDEKYQVSSKVSDVISPMSDRVKQLVSELSAYITQISSLVFAQLKGVNDGLKERLLAATNTGVNFLIQTAASLETKYNVENKLKEIDERYKVTENLKEQAKKLDEKLKVQENAESFYEGALKLDSKYIDGKGKQMFEKAYELGKDMVSGGIEKFDLARRNSRENLAGMNGHLEKN